MIGRLALGDRVRVVEPVDIIDELVCLRSEANWLDVQRVETKVVRVHAQILRLDREELGRQPRAEPLPVERLVPGHVVVVIGVLERHRGYIWLDLANVEEHLVDLLVSVRMRTAQIVALTNALFHLQAVKDGKSDIICENRLHIRVHALNLPHQSIEHLHVHAPLGCDCNIWIQTIHHKRWSQDGYIRANCLHLLLSDPLGTKASALRVWVRTSSRNVDEALDLWRVLDSLCDGNGHTNIRFLKLLLLLVEDMRTDARDRHVRVLQREGDLFLISHILQLEIGLVTQVSRSLDLFEPIVPRARHFTVR